MFKSVSLVMTHLHKNRNKHISHIVSSGSEKHPSSACASVDGNACVVHVQETKRFIILRFLPEVMVEWSTHSCFIFGRSRVQISTWISVILTEGLQGFPQSLQANAGIVP
jgi:hypothetical protein